MENQRKAEEEKRKRQEEEDRKTAVSQRAAALSDRDQNYVAAQALSQYTLL